MLKPTVKPGRLRDGFSLTGSSGINATPTKARQTNATMTVKEETRFISYYNQIFPTAKIRWQSRATSVSV
ncbi:hypothetical protein OSM86_25450, partial [Escherichia coli]|nr:hypothetical protein [Escherichia coli]